MLRGRLSGGSWGCGAVATSNQCERGERALVGLSIELC